MSFPDFVIFGANDGIFADGTGLLGNANNFESVFEIHGILRSHVAKTYNSTTYFRRLLSASRVAHNLVGAVIQIKDIGGRNSFLAAAVLLPDASADADDMTEACAYAFETLQTIREVEIDSNQQLSANFNAKNYLPSGFSSPLTDLGLANNEEISVFRYDESSEISVGGAFFTIQSVEKYFRTMILFTDHPANGAPEISSNTLRTFQRELERVEKERLAEEAREAEAVRLREAQRQEQVEIDLLHRMDALEAKVNLLQSHVNEINALSQHSRTRSDRQHHGGVHSAHHSVLNSSQVREPESTQFPTTSETYPNRSFLSRLFKMEFQVSLDNLILLVVLPLLAMSLIAFIWFGISDSVDFDRASDQRDPIQLTKEQFANLPNSQDVELKIDVCDAYRIVHSQIDGGDSVESSMDIFKACLPTEGSEVSEQCRSFQPDIDRVLATLGSAENLNAQSLLEHYENDFASCKFE